MVTDYTKQEELIVPHKFDKRINVIGCGALGSWVVFFLLKMGFSNIHMYDFDDIEEHNLPNQMFREKDIGEGKVDAMMKLYTNFFNEDTVEWNRLKVYKERITSTNAGALRGVIFCAVDSMKARKEIYEGALKYGRADLWIEGRLGLWGAYLYTIQKMNLAAYDEYEKTLYDDVEAEVSACGISQTALPSAVNCASLMIMQMIRWNNEETIYNKVEYQIPELISMTGEWK